MIKIHIMRLLGHCKGDKFNIHIGRGSAISSAQKETQALFIIGKSLNNLSEPCKRA